MKILSIIIIVLSLISCGGGGGSSSGTVSPNSNPRQILQVFSDESGIGRLKSTDGRTHHYYFQGVEIQRWVDEYDPNDPGNAIDLSRVSKDRELQYTDEYEGTAQLNGRDIEMIGYIDRRSSVSALFLFLDENREDVGTTGYTVSEIPTGRFLYNGQNILTGVDLNYLFLGTFGANVDFSSGVGRMTGLTHGIDGEIVSSRITGTFEIDRNSGNFSSDKNITLTTYDTMDGSNPIEYRASMKGGFHGVGANGVSAVYYTDNINNDAPNIYGTIVGARVD